MVSEPTYKTIGKAPTEMESKNSISKEFDGIRKAGENSRTPSELLHISTTSVELDAIEFERHLLLLRENTRIKLEKDHDLLLRQNEILKEIGHINALEMSGETGQVELPEPLREILQLSAEKRSLSMAEIAGLIHEDDRESILSKARADIANNKSVDVKFRILTPSGECRWVRCHSLPPRGNIDGSIPMQWLVQDITHDKLLCEEVLDKYRESNKALEIANSNLRDFSYSLSHDLKRPARHMNGFAQLLIEAIDSGDFVTASRFAKRISNNASDLSSLIEAMLKFSDLGQHAVAREWIDHVEVVREIVNQATTKPISPNIIVAIDENMPKVFADPSLWRILWTNLIENAFKYSKDRNPIRLSFSAKISSNSACYSIQDNGIGFHQEHSSKIFQMFHRLSNVEHFDGTGIGLALAKRIIEAHGGSIAANAELDKGATFDVLLPLPTATE